MPPLAASRSGRIRAWIGAAGLVALLGYFAGVTHLQNAAQLRASPLQTMGIVTGVKPGDWLNNPTVEYDFNLRRGQSAIPVELEPKLAPGATVTVTFLSDPSGPSAIDPAGEAEAGKRGLLIALFLELIVAAVFLPLAVFAEPDTSKPNWAKGENISAAVVVSILAVAGLGALFFSSIPAYLNSQKLMNQGKTVVGSLNRRYSPVDTSSQPTQMASYTYQVEGRYYHGIEKYAQPTPASSPIVIHYLPDNPSFAAINPAQKASDLRRGMLFLILWNVVVAVSALVFRFGARQDKAPITFAAREDY